MTKAKRTDTSDLELLHLIGEFVDLQRRYHDISAEGGDVILDDKRQEALDAALDAVWNQQGLLMPVICAIPALTLAGMQARAAAIVLWDEELAKHDTDNEGLDFGNHLTAALLRDLVGATRHAA